MDEPHPSQSNFEQTPIATSGANASTGITLGAAPAIAGMYAVLNGVRYEVGDAVKTLDFYFSANGGVTAKDFDNLLVGDTLYWTRYLESFDLDTDDRVTLHYVTIGR